jgi:hypothetical protein
MDETRKIAAALAAQKHQAMHHGLTASGAD